MGRKTFRRVGKTVQHFRNYPYTEDPERVHAREATRTAILNANDIYCAICGKEIHCAITCPIYKKNIHMEHCTDCNYHVAATPANNETCTKKRHLLKQVPRMYEYINESLYESISYVL